MSRDNLCERRLASDVESRRGTTKTTFGAGFFCCAGVPLTGRSPARAARHGQAWTQAPHQHIDHRKAPPPGRCTHTAVAPARGLRRGRQAAGPHGACVRARRVRWLALQPVVVPLTRVPLATRGGVHTGQVRCVHPQRVRAAPVACDTLPTHLPGPDPTFALPTQHHVQAQQQQGQPGGCRRRAELHTGDAGPARGWLVAYEGPRHWLAGHSRGWQPAAADEELEPVVDGPDPGEPGQRVGQHRDAGGALHAAVLRGRAVVTAQGVCRPVASRPANHASGRPHTRV